MQGIIIEVLKERLPIEERLPKRAFENLLGLLSTLPKLVGDGLAILLLPLPKQVGSDLIAVLKDLPIHTRGGRARFRGPVEYRHLVVVEHRHANRISHR